MKTIKNPFFPFSGATLAVVTLASFAVQSAQATSGSWTPAVDGNWGVDASWNGVPAGFPNGEGQAANFSVNTPDLLITTTLDGNYTVSSSAINSGQSSDWLVTSPTNTLTFDNTGTSNASIANNFNGSSLYTLDTNILLNSNLVLSGNGNNGAKVTLGATVGGRSITGVGNITINNTNSFGAGLMTINSNINTTGGIFNTSSQGLSNHLIAGVIGTTVTGVTQNSTKTMILSGNNTYTTPTTVSLGTLQAGVASVANVSGAFGNNSAVTIADAAASLFLNSFNTQIGSLAGGGAVGSTVSLGTATLTTGGLNTDTAFAGAISGTGTSGLTKVGSGTFTLTGNNSSFTGAINIVAGTLVAGRAGNTDISATSAVNLNGGNLLFQPATAFDKTYNGGINVNNAGILSYDNPNITTHTLTLGGTNSLALTANLTVKNTSDVETLVNAINISRVISGPGNLTVETYNNINPSTANLGLGRVLLSGNNSSWGANLVIAKGTVSLSGNAVNAAGTGTIIIGTAADAFGAGLIFFPTGPAGEITYPNAITINDGGVNNGFRVIKGYPFSNHRVKFTGNVTLNEDLTLDHSWGSADNRFTMAGAIGGIGGLTIARSEGNTGTSAVLTGTNTYSGPTLVKSTASLAISSTGSLTSNITVQSGARLGGGGGTTGSLTLEDGARLFFYTDITTTPANYDGFSVTGTVTAQPSFGVASLVGGSQGEPVNWDTTPDGTYTLIGSTPSSLSNIQNFGSVNYATIPVSATSTIPRYAYFEGTTGLQIVVSSTPPVAADPFTTWSGGAAFNIDSNNDGVDNGLAWFLGASDKDVNANALLPKTSQTSGALVLEFDCLNAADRGLVSFAVQYSNDLGQIDPWAETVVPGAAGTFTAGVVDFVVTDPLPTGVGPLKVVATIPVGEAAAGKLFGRINGQR